MRSEPKADTGPEAVHSLRSFERYFDEIDAEAKAYWLGFILADGCVLWNEATGNYALQVALQGTDIDHLITMGLDLGESRQPRIDPRNGTVRLVWYSKYLAHRLIDMGIECRKSDNPQLQVPQVPIPLARHFWRGVFDGDGCLTTQVKVPGQATEYRYSLAGSLPVLGGFQEWARMEAGIRPQRIVKARNSQGESKTFVFYMNGNRQIASLLNALYRDCTRTLRRKYDVYLALLEQNARIRPSYRRHYLS